MPKDYVAAHKWFNLAAAGKTKLAAERAAEGRDWLARKMTPAQIAEAERLVAEWDPNPAECEVYAEQADN